MSKRSRAFCESAPILVIGAGSDMGQAIAQKFAADGHPVQLAARKPDKLADIAADIHHRHGVEVSTYQIDVRDIEAASSFYDSLPTMPVIVISVAGLLGEQTRTAASPDLIRAVTETNFTGPAAYLAEAARRLAPQEIEGSAVIGVSSVAGDRGRAVNWWYGASKAGFSEALSGLRQENARNKLHVMTVKPGFVATAMTAGMDLPAALTSSADQQAALVKKGYDKGRLVVYDLRWLLVMTIIKLVPEPIFKRMKF